MGPLGRALRLLGGSPNAEPRARPAEFRAQSTSSALPMKWIIKATTREVVEATPVAMMGPAKLSKMQLQHHRFWSP